MVARRAPIDEEDPVVVGEVTRGDIEEVIARWTGIPITSLKEEESKKLLRIEAELHKRVISQRPAISALARAIRRSRAGLKNPHRPVGSSLFFGADRCRQNGGCSFTRAGFCSAASAR
jgi:ATP-dependent Clp protease ATP-binding subunit ClpC